MGEQYLNDLPINLDDHGRGTGSRQWVWSLSFAPDGQSLMTGAGDGIIRYWPTQPDDMASEMCGYDVITANMSQNTWDAYVGEDIEYRFTCEELPKRKDN